MEEIHHIDEGYSFIKRVRQLWVKARAGGSLLFVEIESRADSSASIMYL